MGSIDLQNVIYEVRHGAAWITINRPKQRNSLSSQTYGDIRDAFRFANYDQDVDIIVFTGVDPDFAVGGDLYEGAEIMKSGDPMRFHAFEDKVPYDTIRASKKTVITMVNGNCVGGGLCMTGCTDLVVASDRARFGIPEAKSGVFDPWGPEFLSPRLSRARVNYLAYTGELISAETALEWGIINDIAPHDELEDRVVELLGKVRQTTPAARAGYKNYIMRYDHVTPSIAASADVQSTMNSSEFRWRGAEK